MTLCAGLWKSSEISNLGARFDGGSVTWKRGNWDGGVVTPKSMVNRTGWGSADLRHQHLFVLKAGDPREMSCNSEKHSSRDSPFAWPCMLHLFEYLITLTHKQSWTIAFFPSCAFTCVPEILCTPRYCIFDAFWVKLQTTSLISALTKRAVTLELFAVPTSCVQRQGEREGSQALRLPRWPRKATPPVHSTRSGVTGIWLVGWGWGGMTLGNFCDCWPAIIVQAK